jgi:hypothetical protein
LKNGYGLPLVCVKKERIASREMIRGWKGNFKIK